MNRNRNYHRKRKRETICGLGAFTQAFAIRPYSGSVYNQSIIFKPVRIITRSRLPLTFLDSSASDDNVPNSLFAAQISILEHNGDVEEEGTSDPKVLIARHETKRVLYAIERVQKHVYSIFRLAKRLKEKEVADLWDPSNRPVLRVSSHRNTSATGEWWQHAVVETEIPERLPQRARMTMMRHKAQQEPAIEKPQETMHVVATEAAQDQTPLPADLPQDSFLDLPSPQEQLTSLLQQYLDAVYLSKTSLAYFAKGPIARLRNVFTSPEQGAPPTYELTTFLRSMLLSPKASEKKYYEKLPTLIKAIPPGSLSDEEPMEKIGKSKKPKKKAKISRDGVYPQEGLVIKKWWLSSLSNE